MSTHIDPVQFTRSYLRELGQSRSGVEDAPSGGSEIRDTMWYNPDDKKVPDIPPSPLEFERDIRNMKDAGTPERALESYCGLALLTAVMTAANAGGAPLAGAFYLGLASEVGKVLAGDEVERKIGQDGFQVVAGKYGICKDPSFTSRLESVADRVVAHSKLDSGDLKYSVLDTDEINAHALPGHLLITRGLMERFSDDGQLAFFIGHEIAHMEDKDSLEDVGQEAFEYLAVNRTLMKSKVQVEGTSSSIGDYRKSVKETLLQADLSLDKHNELKADRRGAELMKLAGYEGEDARKALSTIVGIERDTQLEMIGKKVEAELGFRDMEEVMRRYEELQAFARHPSLEERMQAIRGFGG